jgi:hypothetical protein
MDESGEVIEYCSDRMQASFLRGLLEANEIPARMKAPQGLGGSGAKIYGGYTVLVSPKDAVRARQLLDTLARDAAKEAEEDEAEEASPSANASPGLLHRILGVFRRAPETPQATPHE